MGIFPRIRATRNGFHSVTGVPSVSPRRRWALTKVAAVTLFVVSAFGLRAGALEAQSTYQITSATYGSNGSASVPAGVNGALLTLTGTLPTAAQQAASPLLACFYTGSGSTTGLALSSPNTDGTEPLTVPASAIDSIPPAQFTAANKYSVQALVYFIAASGTCDGSFDTTLTNQYPVQVVAPSLGAYTGPTSIPQTNATTNVQASPFSLNIPAGGFLPSATTGGATTVTFGSFGSVALAVPATATSSINVPVPAAFSSSTAGTTASLSICNTFTGVTTPVCTTPTPAITLTVTALATSSGTVTASPNPALTSSDVILTAQFTKSATAGTAAGLGAPSGTVTFVADGTTLPAARLVLDPTATFATQTTTVTTPAAATPVITPAAGSYTTAQTVTITDATPGAAIYYTQDGSTPTAASTLYTAPFTITTSQTVSAIAGGAGFLTSAVASTAYTVTIHPATQLAFQVQPVTTPINSPITPAVQVAVGDATGAVVSGSTAPVTLTLRSNPGEATLGGTLTVNAVNGIATFSDLTLNHLSPAGAAYTLFASSGTLTGVQSTGFNITPPAITMTVQSELVGINSTLNGSFTLSSAAPAGGLVVTLTSGTPANVTIAPATVTVPAGTTTGVFTYTGVAAGNATLSAAATGYTTGTVMTTATAAQVSLGMIPNVAPAQMQSLALSLPGVAPPGGTTVTFTIANQNIATVTQSVFVAAGQSTPAANPQVTGVLIGNTTVTASAPGYAPVTRPVVVTVTAAFNPGTTNINLATASNTSLTISAPAPPGGITFTLTSDNPMVATVSSTITVVAGATSVPISITGVSAGSTTIRADSAGITEATGTVNVNSNIGNSTFVTGYSLEQTANLYLPVAPSTPTTVTMTVADPTVAVITTDSTVAGQAVLTFPNTTRDYIGTIAVQGLKVGATTITISAPGYTTGTITVTVNPSGFVINGYQLSISTTTYSGVYSLTVYPAILNPDLSYYTTSTLNPQSATISLPVTSSSPAIGTVNSPLVFPPLNTQQSISFQPVAAGTTNINLGAPPTGFSVGADHQQSVATVTTPVITVDPYTTGQKLQGSVNLYLPEPTPNAVTVTVTSSDTTKATISASDTVAGTGTLTYNVAAGQRFIGTIWYQGQALGSSTITVSADSGYISGSNTVTVYPSGFYYVYTGNFSTTTFSGTTNLNVYTAALNPTTATNPLSLYTFGYELNPGVAPVTVPLSNSDPTVGTVAGGGVVFTAGKTGVSTTFQPSAAGTTNIAITTPSGFSTAAPAQTITATVTAPTMYNYDNYTGVKLQNNFNIGIPVATPSPETVTVASSNAAIFTVSTSETVAGTGSLTFTTTNGSGQSIWIQGQSAGTATLTVSAPGFTSSTSTITVYPSGFAFYGYYTPPYTTTTFSGQSSPAVGTITIGSSGSINGYIGQLPLNPGVTATVAITDGTPTVGMISSAALVFTTGDSSHTFNFTPVAAGTTNLAITTPVGFTTPMSGSPSVPQNQSGIVTVTAPGISIGNVTTAVNLQQSLSINLTQTPPSNGGNGVTVTVTSSSPTLATLSKDPTVAGTPSVVFNNVTSTNVGTIYVQGQALGTAQLTETAPGYTDGSSTVTVQPAGFAFYNGGQTFTTTVASGPYTLTAYPFALNTGTQTLIYYPLMVSPGLGNVTVPVTSSNTAVGTTPSGPSFAPGAPSADFHFVPVGTGTSTVTLGTPAGFSTPSQNLTVTGTVQ